MLVATPAPPVPELLLSRDDARRMTLRAQGFLGSEGRRGGVPGMLRRLGAVQLDTISVLARPVPGRSLPLRRWRPTGLLPQRPRQLAAQRPVQRRLVCAELRVSCR